MARTHVTSRTLTSARTLKGNRFPFDPQILDTFTRANNTLSLGLTEQGNGTWKNGGAGIFGISGNQGYDANGTADVGAYLDFGKSNVEIEVACASGGGALNYCIYFRGSTDVTNGAAWRFIRNASTLILQRKGATQKTVSNLTFTTLDVFRVRCYGNNIQCFFNGAKVIDINDATNNTSTKHGFGIGSPSQGTNHLFDNFKMWLPL